MNHLGYYVTSLYAHVPEQLRNPIFQTYELPIAWERQQEILSSSGNSELINVCFEYVCFLLKNNRSECFNMKSNRRLSVCESVVVCITFAHYAAL